MIAEVVVLALVVYRVWRILGRDQIGAWTRDHLDPWLLEFVSCPWCFGTWLTIIIGLLTTEFGLTSTSPWLLIPAAAALVGLIGGIDRA